MTTVDTTTSAGDLLAMPDGGRIELVGGKLLERPVSVLSSWVGGRVFRLLSDFVDAQDLGRVWPADNGLQCFSDAPEKVRRADGSVGWLKEQDELEGENVLAGFRCSVGTLFPSPPGRGPAAT